MPQSACLMRLLALTLLLWPLHFAAAAPPEPLKTSVVRLNATVQAWNAAQPWEKTAPASRRALAAIVAPCQVLTTAEMVANATHLAFESPDGTRFASAKVLAVDYEANLALLGPANPGDQALFANTQPATIAPPTTIGEELEIYQIEESGRELRTPGTLQNVELTPTFLPGQAFLTYQVKASMQSAASSYSLPVFARGQLAGVLSSYDSKDQLCEIIATTIVSRFLHAAASQPYVGFPSIGVATARTDDPSFRQWLKLPDDQGGLFLSAVRTGGAADTAGVKKGDVLMAVDGQAIDRRGYYTHPTYGSLSWGHLIRGERAVGDTVTLSLIRDGTPVEVKATLTREDPNARLVPNYVFDRQPNYLVKGGLIFQELTRTLLEAFGQDWAARAPLDLLDAVENPEKYQDRADRIVFLSGVIPTPATVGYEPLRNLVVHEVNGKPIRNLQSLIDAFSQHPGPLHAIRFDRENFTVHLDETTSRAVDQELLQRGIPKLSHFQP